MSDFPPFITADTFFFFKKPHFTAIRSHSYNDHKKIETGAEVVDNELSLIPGSDKKENKIHTHTRVLEISRERVHFYHWPK